MITYMIAQGESNNNNNEVLWYAKTLKEAKHVVIDQYSYLKDVFILAIEGPNFGEGFHKYTLEYKDFVWIKNTKI